MEHVDRNQVLRLRILLKPSAPRATVGIGPEIKTDFPLLVRKFKRSLKSFLVSSDCLRAVSLEPTWTRTLFMEDGRECNSAGSFFRRTGTVDPGKQCVATLIKRTFRIIESPTINVVGEKSGRGEDGC